MQDAILRDVEPYKDELRRARSKLQGAIDSAQASKVLINLVF